MPFEDYPLDKLLTGARQLAAGAGERIMQIYEAAAVDVSHKDDRSPLTEADLAAHEYIVTGLKTLTPDLPVLSEESEQMPFSLRSQWDAYWLVDPLDGTREFLKRNGEFTVNIALVHGHEPVLGVVAAPALDRSWFAAAGQGAWQQRNNEEATPIRVRNKARRKPVVAVTRSHGSDELQRYLEWLGEHEPMSMGSALKLCLVADGTVDLYPRIGPTSEWDTAAAQCVVCEAGGQVVDMEGNPLRYNTKESLLNPYFLVYGDASRSWRP
ncbi:MAG: 3'(2'),5'-bisphosphate nucleotidase CysQ [Ectothiorhodospiraceae bacterium]|jgi:3'(2'), 5'-bisphosphate nucleotidase|nr:3'(2'),5'-bisphosphate nucleotidase CysQ [Ectothiorhodospiraceae bacterium]